MDYIFPNVGVFQIYFFIGSKLLQDSSLSGGLRHTAAKPSIVSTGNLPRNRNSDPTSWVSCLEKGSLYTIFSITDPEFLVFL